MNSMEELIKHIEDKIAENKKEFSSINDASWSAQKGVLITVKDAIEIINELKKESKICYPKVRAAAIEYSKDKIKGTSADDETNRGYAVKDFIEGANWVYNNKI